LVVIVCEILYIELKKICNKQSRAVAVNIKAQKKSSKADEIAQ